MPEQEPYYFKEFRKHIDKRFDAVENKIDKEIDDLAAMTKRQFDYIEEKMATKNDIKELDAHIGRYERSLQPMEEIVLKDHRVRIRTLEKATGI
jgi:cob(I)alamin adenosyltransferase